MKQYLHDLQIVQEYAQLNRDIILKELAQNMKWKVTDTYSCIHNYVDESEFGLMLRKGAISVKLGEKVVIPINMRDGILLGTGLGNTDWNCSAPHGAGRILKRSDVSDKYTLSQFKKEMKGIYSGCISKETLDEAPFAYRDMASILNQIKETVTVTKHLRPVYNFKASE